MSRESNHLEFLKIQGTGNDFVFIDARSPGQIPADRPDLVRWICRPHFGIGADGVVFVENNDDRNVPLKWDFYNSDGSTAEMCGNAARCMGRWALAVAGVDQVSFLTKAGPVEASADREKVSVHLRYLKLQFHELKFQADDAVHFAYLVNTGVPHAVVEIDAIENASKRMDIVRALRFHKDAGPKGANVTFLQRLTESDFKTVTFERGVEDFTLSCGTGVLAAAAVGLQASGGESADLLTPGGPLHVRLPRTGHGAWLIGPAEIAFTGKVALENFK